MGICERLLSRKTLKKRVVGACAALALSSANASANAQSAIRLEDAGQAEAAYFVLETHLDSAASLEEMRRWYADRVSYYGRGLQDRALVLTDKKYYIDRWPERTVTPDLSTLEIQTVAKGMYDVAVEVEFSVKNDTTAIDGRTLVELTLEEGPDGLLKITRESGRILSRRKPTEN